MYYELFFTQTGNKIFYQYSFLRWEKITTFFSLLFFSFVCSSAALGIFSQSPAHPQMTQMFADNIRMATFLRLSAQSADYCTIHSSISGLGELSKKFSRGAKTQRGNDTTKIFPWRSLRLREYVLAFDE